MRTSLVVLPLFCCLLLPLTVEAEWFSDPQLSGSMKTLNLYLDRLPTDNEEGLVSSESLRLELNATLAREYQLEFAVQQQLLWTDPCGVAALPTDSVNHRFDLEQSWNRGGRFSSQLQLDRFNIHREGGNYEWTLGRQAIGFGRISLFSPLDVIAPFSPDVIDSDVRPGVDAVRAVRYFGLAGQVGGVAVFGDKPQHNSYLVTLGENVANFDLLALVGSLRDRPMIGLGIAGELGPLGIKAEASWYKGQDVGQVGGDLRDDFVIAAIEGWYRFDNGLTLIGEYLYNGAGSHRPEEYPQVATSAPINEGLSFLLGRHYLLLGPSYELNPLVTASGLLIHNLEDRSSLLRPQLSISLSDNLQLDLFWAFASGKKRAIDQFTGLPVTRSEFGSMGDSGGLLLRWYF